MFDTSGMDAVSQAKLLKDMDGYSILSNISQSVQRFLDFGLCNVPVSHIRFS